ncbi:MAG: GspH/FimT family protein [Syntrophales bacterium LBB04]|nr:GspH/FimT family protein [Syntrophales bacterium LBB04]
MGILSKQGLTFIELIIVIVILMIMTTVLLPDYTTFMLQRRLNGAAYAVMADLMLARSQAISLNRNVSVLFSTSPSSQYTYDDTGVATIKNIQTGLGYFDVTLSADYKPVFSSRGIAANAGGTNPVATVTVRNPAGAKTVTVNIARQVANN